MVVLVQLQAAQGHLGILNGGAAVAAGAAASEVRGDGVLLAAFHLDSGIKRLVRGNGSLRKLRTGNCPVVEIDTAQAGAGSGVTDFDRASGSILAIVILQGDDLTALLDSAVS